ncbi:hypothetical protein M5K25_018305 [Dendrobium thyrsiflorum]|uniref:Uncharacterized protein n=1 Tax=Dendrobium thyrsiflorum TaxID=117978 RepID=A0ABD0UHN1_DENTH
MRRSHRTRRALAGRGSAGRGIVTGTGRRVQGAGVELEAQGAGTGCRVRVDAQGAKARHKGCSEIDCIGRSATGADLSRGGAKGSRRRKLKKRVEQFLRTKGFRKVDHDKWVFKNEGFVKGQKLLLKTITRKKSTYNNINPQQQIQGKLSSVKAVEVGQFGIEEEIERLKRDKNLLMQELVAVRQHQQSTDAEINDLRQRLQVMERNQQQMLSFLAMAVQSPSFLSQLVQQNINGRWRSEMNKKRRLPALEDGVVDGLESSNKQIIKYEPSLMETLDHYEEPELSSDPSKSSQSLCNGINDLCANVDHIFIGEESCKSGEGENNLDFSEYLEKLLASPILEDTGQTEPLYFDIPDFTFDFDFPVQDVEMETSQNTVSSDGVLQ